MNSYYKMACKLSEIQKEALLIALEPHLNHEMFRGMALWILWQNLVLLSLKSSLCPVSKRQMGGGGLQLPGKGL